MRITMTITLDMDVPDTEIERLRENGRFSHESALHVAAVSKVYHELRKDKPDFYDTVKIVKWRRS